MKNIITICAALVLTVSAFAQAPEKMSYQAVIRDGNNILVTSAPVGMQLSVLQGSAGGTAVYVETQTPTTNANGLVSLEMGAGTPVSGTFSTIDWANGPYFIKTETDPTGGTNYTITGTSQLLSTAYALHAKTAETVTGGINELDPVFTAWDKSTGISITESQISDLGTYIETETDPRVPIGTQNGEMQYWNGTAWITVAPGIHNQTLHFCEGVPTWGECPADVINPTTGEIWMDRNVGAAQVATSSTDPASYGDYYQWGRGKDGHEKPNSNVTFVASTLDSPGHGDFIASVNEPFDWRSGQNANLWQGVSGINNPCPSGYRVPTTVEWEAERLSWSSSTSGGAFDAPIKLPLAGSRNFQDGADYGMDEFGFYWSSTVYGPFSIILYIHPMVASPFNNYRAQGFSVRCIKD